jgi:hypothetical protein
MAAPTRAQRAPVCRRGGCCGGAGRAVAERHGRRKWLPDGGWRLKQEKNVEPKDVGTFSKLLTNIFTKMIMNFFENVGFNIFFYINVGATS